MITRIAQGPSLQRRTKVPCSCQSTADFCWLPPWRRLPLWQAPGVPVLLGIPHLLQDPVHTELPGTVRAMGTGKSSSAPLPQGHSGTRPQGSVLWAKGAGCLGWRMGKRNHQSRAGRVCKRLWDTTCSVLALIAMDIIAMVSALPHSPCSISTFRIFMFKIPDFRDFMAFSMQFSFHIHAWTHTSTCGSCLASSAWVPHEDDSGVLRWSKTLPIQCLDHDGCKLLWRWRNFLWQDTRLPPAKVTLSEARWLSKCTLAERATDTNRGYTVTVCQVCWQGWGQAGLCEWQRFLSDPGTRAGLPSPPPTATPRPSHLGGAAAAAAAGGHAWHRECAPLAGAGLQDPLGGAVCSCAAPL